MVQDGRQELRIVAQKCYLHELSLPFSLPFRAGMANGTDLSQRKSHFLQTLSPSEGPQLQLYIKYLGMVCVDAGFHFFFNVHAF